MKFFSTILSPIIAFLTVASIPTLSHPQNATTQQGDCLRMGNIDEKHECLNGLSEWRKVFNHKIGETFPEFDDKYPRWRIGLLRTSSRDYIGLEAIHSDSPEACSSGAKIFSPTTSLTCGLYRTENKISVAFDWDCTGRSYEDDVGELTYTVTPPSDWVLPDEYKDLGTRTFRLSHLQWQKRDGYFYQSASDFDEVPSMGTPWDESTQEIIDFANALFSGFPMTAHWENSKYQFDVERANYGISDVAPRSVLRACWIQYAGWYAKVARFNFTHSGQQP